MEIRYLGHSTFELVDGDARVLVDPFLKPNSPTALVTADEVDPTHILLTHAHVDHLADAVAVAKRTGAHCVALVETAVLARTAGRRERLGPEPRRNRRVRLGLGEAGAGASTARPLPTAGSRTRADW